MDVGTASIVGLMSLIALNYLTVRTQLARRYEVLFWLVSGVDVVAAVAVLIFGFPGFPQSGLVRLVVGLVLLMHLAQNLQQRTRWRAEEREVELEEELEERRRYEEQERRKEPEG